MEVRLCRGGAGDAVRGVPRQGRTHQVVEGLTHCALFTLAAGGSCVNLITGTDVFLFVCFF